MDSVFGAILSNLAKYSVEPVFRQIVYVIQYKSNIRNLKTEVQHLDKRRSTVQLQVDAAGRNLETILPEVEPWLLEVEVVVQETETRFGEERVSKAWCCNGWCPNPKTRHSLGRKAKKMSTEVEKLLTRGNFLTVSIDAPIRPRTHEVGTSSGTSKSTSFESRASIMKDVIDALKDNHTNPIIICGMSGIGKTTMLKDIFNCEEAGSLFGEIVMVEVSRTDDYLRELQKEIADLLGLKCLSELTNFLARADTLSRRLRSLSKKVLVILDDVWEDIDFEKVGIPLGEICKVLISTRFQHLYNEVTTKKKFTLHLLKEEEAWSLFKKMAGDSIESPNLHPIAEQVLQKCDGLPIAISMMGKALRDKGERIWGDAIRRLENPSQENISEEGVIKKLHPNIEFCYQCLESEEAKSFFFLCCLYPEGSDIQVEDLVRHGLGLGLFKNIDSVVQGRNRVEALIDRLKDRSLLLDSYKAGCVKMHDLLRGVALLLDSPASRERNSTIKVRNRFFVRYGAQLINNWFRNIEASTSAELHNSEKSQFLLLSCTEDSAEAPEDILKVLDLKNANMVSMPSLPHFQSIQTLCLEHWELVDVSIIGELRTLMILSLRHSSMNELPQSFRNLSNLWILDLTGSRILKFDIISSGIISSLRKLQELYMLVHAGERFHYDFIEIMHKKDYFIKWDAKKQDEVLSWKCRLTTLEVDIREVSLEFRERCELFGGLERFNILIGFNVLDGECLQGLRSLKLENENTLENIGDAFFQHRSFPVLHSVTVKNSKILVRICNSQPSMRLFEELRRVELYYVYKLRFVFPLSMAREDLHQLEELHIRSCSNLEVIVASEEERKKENNEICKLPNLTQLNLEDLPDFIGFSQVNIGFPLLISIRLVELPKLVTLCPSDSATESSSSATIRHLFDAEDESFLELRFVKVISCNSISTMFSLSSTQSLQNLEDLWVECCRSLKSLFDFGDPTVKAAKEASSTLSCMKNMTLMYLPLEYVWNPVHWKIQAFQNLRVLKISGCRKLKNVFPPCIAKGLVNLEKICMSECDSMEEIVFGNERSRDQEDETTATEKIVFAKVESLELTNLHSLARFCGAPCMVEWPSLRKLVLRNLSKLSNISGEAADFQSHVFKEQDLFFLEVRFLEVSGCDLISSRMFSFTSMQSFQNLEHLSLENCQSLKTLFDSGDPNAKAAEQVSLELDYIKKPHPKIQAFQSLRILKIHHCGKLKYVFPPYIAEGLVNLEEFSAGYCHSLEEIICGNQGSKISTNKIVLPRVKSLELTVLSSLLRFCGAPCIVEWPSLTQLVIEELGVAESHIFNEKDGLFLELQLLKVIRCDSISRMFSSNSMQRLQRLENLRVENCQPLTTVFYLGDLDVKAKDASVMLSRLEEMILICLPMLEYVWEPHLKIQAFQSLKILKISFCQKLRNVFPCYIADGLVKLEQFSVYDCDLMEEIICRNNEATENKIVFSQVQSVELTRLPSLRRFCGAPCIVEWPSLRKLLLTILWKFTNHSGDVADNQSHVFNEKVDYPVLEELEIVMVPCIKEIWGGQVLPQYSFSQLRKLSVSYCCNLSVVIPSHMRQRLQKLESLNVSNCWPVSNIFKYGESSHTENAFPISQQMKISPMYCKGSLKENPSLANLKELKVEQCHNVRILLCHAAARGLVNLEKLSVYFCRMMEEIVSGPAEGDEAEDNTSIFPRLSCLTLYDVPNLTCFSKGNYSFRWPQMVEFDFQGYRNMQTFCCGSALTPNLQKVELSPYSGAVDSLWKADLNILIQHISSGERAMPKREEVRTNIVK